MGATYLKTTQYSKYITTDIKHELLINKSGKNVKIT